MAYKLIDSLTQGKELTYKSLKELAWILNFEGSIDGVCEAIIKIEDGELVDANSANRKKEIEDNIKYCLGKQVFNLDDNNNMEPVVKKVLGIDGLFNKILSFSTIKKLIDLAIDQQQQREVEITTNNILAGLELDWKSIHVDVLEKSIENFLDIEKNPPNKPINFIGNDGAAKQTKSGSLEERIAYLDQQATLTQHNCFESDIKHLIQKKKPEIIPNTSTKTTFNFTLSSSSQNNQQ